MARGNEAKKQVIAKIQSAFGADWIGESNSKYYVWANENGERLQIAIALTCPKTMIETASGVGKADIGGDFDWSDTGVGSVAVPVARSASVAPEISEEEKANIQRIMEKFNL